jgi:hypothetical protein
MRLARRRMVSLAPALAALAALASVSLAGALASGCSSTPAPPPAEVAGGAKGVFSPEADLAAEGAFWDLPYPSDLRLTAAGVPDLKSFPNPALSIIDEFKKLAEGRKGFPVVPVAYFRFDAPLGERKETDAFAATKDSPVLLVDVDEKSPDRGKLYPVVAGAPAPDAYVPEHLLTLAARPGVALSPSTKYAFVVRRSFTDAAGRGLTPAQAFEPVLRGEAPAGARGEALRGLYAPLLATLDTLGVARTDVAAATVFTTGDVVADTAELAKRVSERFPVTTASYTLEALPSLQNAPFCHVTAKIDLPQFQRGKAPFDAEGLFDLGEDGVPKKQRDESIAVSFSIPKTVMPQGGYPLVVYFHGSGGVAREFIDGGEKGDPFDVWPAATLAPLGFAMAGAAMPISPDRVPGAKSFDYVNLNNLPAVRDTFRQGMLESRLLIDALAKTEIPKSVLDACAGASLPAGATAYKLDLSRLSVQGQSMGGMYTNLVSAIEPRVQAAVPTGAGGFWIYFVLRLTVIPNAYNLIRLLIGTREQVTFMHPALHLIETALEVMDPLVSTPRLGRRPLPGHPTRSVYEPVGKEDSYFNTDIFDAMALGYGHPRAGTEVWPSMRAAQSLVGLDKPVEYPVKQNLASADGRPFTGVVAQYDNKNAQGTFDGHGIYRRLEAVRYQYGCFHSTFQKTGVAVVPAPAPLGTPCPQ